MKTTVEIPAEQAFILFKLAHEIATNSEIAYNDEIQYQAIDLVTSLASYLIDFEMDVFKNNGELPYPDSVLNNPEYEHYHRQN